MKTLIAPIFYWSAWWAGDRYKYVQKQRQWWSNLNLIDKRVNLCLVSHPVARFFFHILRENLNPESFLSWQFNLPYPRSLYEQDNFAFPWTCSICSWSLMALRVSLGSGSIPATKALPFPTGPCILWVHKPRLRFLTIFSSDQSPFTSPCTTEVHKKYCGSLLSSVLSLLLIWLV